MRYWERNVKAGGSPVLAGAGILAGVVIWQLLSLLIGSKLILPSAFDVLGQLFAAAEQGVLLPHIYASLLRILAGFAMGSVIGAALGLAMGISGILRALLDPLANFFRFIPPICWISPFLIWFGIGETSKVLIITYTVTFVVLLSTYAGVRSIPRNRIRAARCFGAGPLFMFFRVVLPSVARDVRLGMRIGLGNAFTTVVTAEMIAAQTGLGFVILTSRNYGATGQIILAMICLGATGFIADRAFDITSKAAFANYLRR
jgi:NitT/TauT family transport system permease protein